MTTVLASPTEPRELIKALGAVISPLCEENGADYLIYSSRCGLVGLQRKEVPNDFISSFTDGRMAMETSLLTKHCKFSRIIAEGRFRYWPDGKVIIGRINPKTKKPEPSVFTRKHIKGMIFDIEFIKGIVVDWTEDIQDTVLYIEQLVRFLEIEKHLGLYNRPSASGAWYVPTAKDIELWLLQSFSGIGPATADKIIEYFGGRIPMKWSCTLDELKDVPGLSRKRAEVLWESLPMGVSSGGLESNVEETLNEMRNMLKGLR